MNFNRYNAVLRTITLTIDELEHPTSLKTFIRIAMQYGKRLHITTDEILEVLGTSPFTKVIKKS